MATKFTCAAATSAENNIYDTNVEGINCPVYGSFFGIMGSTAAMVFSGALPSRACAGQTPGALMCPHCDSRLQLVAPKTKTGGLLLSCPCYPVPDCATHFMHQHARTHALVTSLFFALFVECAVMTPVLLQHCIRFSSDQFVCHACS